MRHLFVSPHPDDAALSCGGLILALTDAGETVDILTIFSGSGPYRELTPYQRLALGFGVAPQAGAAAEAGAAPQAGAAAGAAGAASDADIPTPARISSIRRAEDRAYARMAGASILHLDLPDAVFRQYLADDQLCADPRPDDQAPVGHLRAVIHDLRPGRIYLPLAVGSHVDHRMARRAGMSLLAEPDVMPIESVRFYEDFPYAASVGFGDLGQLDAELATAVPAGRRFGSESVSIEAVLERKVAGLRAYPSQLGRLFGGDDPMARAFRERATLVGRRCGTGPAERYWQLVEA